MGCLESDEHVPEVRALTIVALRPVAPLATELLGILARQSALEVVAVITKPKRL